MNTVFSTPYNSTRNTPAGFCCDTANAASSITAKHTAARSVLLTMAVCMMVVSGSALANETSNSADPRTGKDPRIVGTATNAWLAEQRDGINRAEPEPYPADRAAAAVRRYESTVGSDATGSGSRSGGIGIRSGSSSSTPPPTSGAPTMGMTR